jgi:hypothetical protein
MKTELPRTCPSCSNEFSGAMEFCPVCMLRKALADFKIRLVHKKDEYAILHSRHFCASSLRSSLRGSQVNRLGGRFMPNNGAFWRRVEKVGFGSTCLWSRSWTSTGSATHHRGAQITLARTRCLSSQRGRRALCFAKR